MVLQAMGAGVGSDEIDKHLLIKFLKELGRQKEGTLGEEQLESGMDRMLQGFPNVT